MFANFFFFHLFLSMKLNVVFLHVYFSSKGRMFSGGSSMYTVATHDCCGSKEIIDRSTQGCCGGTFSGMSYDLRTEGCCSNTRYRLDEKVCCDGKLEDIKESED